ncbi:MAG: SurA N-terminal domain-containing protein [Gammaproteobacteria bacterium]|nr:SurA N-terminal domain-containing protein [Gammaproteobacteria bacterium]
MKNLLKLLSIAVGLGLSSIISANTALPQPVSSVQTLDAIVAVVNDEVITQTELDKAITNLKRQLQMGKQAIPPAAELRNGVLQQLIYQKIQTQLAKRAGITVSNAQVTSAIKTIAKNNKVTLAALKAKLAKDGIRFSAFKKSIKQQLIINTLQRQAVGATVRVTDADVDQFFDKYNSQPQNATLYHVLDILVATPSGASQKQLTNAKNTAQKIASDLKRGVALTAIQGGQQTDLGWTPLSQLPDLFANKVKTMKMNDIAGPLQAANGFHVIQLQGIRKSNRQAPTRQQVRQMLFQQKFQQALVKWLQKMRKSAYVKITDE